VAEPRLESILVWGAGAIGGTLGAAWARAGKEVLLVDADGDHVGVMNACGVTIEGPVENYTQPVQAVTPDTVNGRYPLVVLAVKAHHTEGAVRELAPHLSEDGAVVSAQNGLNEIVIAKAVGEARTIGCFINYGADYLEPGRIMRGNRGAVVVGEIDGRVTPRIKAVHELFRLFEPDAELTNDIWGYLWGKLAYGALLFATALTNESIADALASERHHPVYRRVGEEVMRVATARGVTPRGFNGFDPGAFTPGSPDAATRASIAAMIVFNRRSAKSHSGIWRDLAVRKRKTEVDAQVAIVADLGGMAGDGTPALRRLVALIHAIENEERPLAWSTLDEMLSACT
jgi:2-dehydropantoate 2-reductase